MLLTDKIEYDNKNAELSKLFLSILGRGLGLPYPRLQWVWPSNVLSSTQGVTTLTYYI